MQKSKRITIRTLKFTYLWYRIYSKLSKICSSGLGRNKLLYYFNCQYSHWNPDEYAVMLCNFRCSLLIVHLFSITYVVTWLIDLHHGMVASARWYKTGYVFGIERPPNWIRQNYMPCQFRMSQTILRFVRLWYFLQHDEADTAQRSDFLITWRDSTLQLPYHMVYEHDERKK